MSAHDLDRALTRSLADWRQPRPRRRAPQTVETTPGMTITYIARRHRLAPDDRYTVTASTISRLEATLAAERDARRRGLQFGHVVDYGRAS